MERLSMCYAQPLRDHELRKDRAIKLANTGNRFNFLVRILCRWAGQSLPFKSSHLCIFTVWLGDKFKNKRKQAFPPEKHSPWNDERESQGRHALFAEVSFFHLLKRDLCLLWAGAPCLRILMASPVPCHWTWESKACKTGEGVWVKVLQIATTCSQSGLVNAGRALPTSGKAARQHSCFHRISMAQSVLKPLWILLSGSLPSQRIGWQFVLRGWDGSTSVEKETTRKLLNYINDSV